MKTSLIQKTLILLFVLSSFNSFACDCDCRGDCSFNAISNQNGFVALIKVIEYTDFLDHKILGYDKDMPFSMTVEIIKKYKGVESKKRIKIWGDNGILCRPYISNFEVGKYYLIAPRKILSDSDEGDKGDYDFFACYTDYLSVDFYKGIAFGEYSTKQKEVSLSEFESTLKK